MTAPKMTRKRALEKALECMKRQEITMRKTTQLAIDNLCQSDEYKAKKETEYAEHVEAMGIIEHMGRQGEMHL
jgi:hypothetical protein